MRKIICVFLFLAALIAYRTIVTERIATIVIVIPNKVISSIHSPRYYNDNTNHIKCKEKKSTLSDGL